MKPTPTADLKKYISNLTKKSNMGLPQQNPADAICGELATHLANLYTFYTKAYNFHWNVVGPRFEPLHGFFGEIYELASCHVDAIAENIRFHNKNTPGGLVEFAQLRQLEDAPSSGLDENNMLILLYQDVELFRSNLANMINLLEGSPDQGTLDLLSGHLGCYDKLAWKLRSFLGQ